MTITHSSLVEELDQGVADLKSSLITIAHGGSPENLIGQIQALASALSDYRTIEGRDPPLDRIIVRLRSLDPNQ